MVIRRCSFYCVRNLLYTLGNTDTHTDDTLTASRGGKPFLLLELSMSQSSGTLPVAGSLGPDERRRLFSSAAPDKLDSATLAQHADTVAREARGLQLGFDRHKRREGRFPIRRLES